MDVWYTESTTPQFSQVKVFDAHPSRIPCVLSARFYESTVPLWVTWTTEYDSSMQHARYGAKQEARIADHAVVAQMNGNQVESKAVES